MFAFASWMVPSKWRKFDLPTWKDYIGQTGLKPGSKQRFGICIWLLVWLPLCAESLHFHQRIITLPPGFTSATANTLWPALRSPFWYMFYLYGCHMCFEFRMDVVTFPYSCISYFSLISEKFRSQRSTKGCGALKRAWVSFSYVVTITKLSPSDDIRSRHCVPCPVLNKQAYWAGYTNCACWCY